MWIRSQDKTKLVNCIGDNRNNIYIDKKENGIYYGVRTQGFTRLGTYSTEEKMLKVLDDIQKRIITCECAKMKSNMMDRCFHPVIKEATLLVFEMPEDEEVNMCDI